MKENLLIFIDFTRRLVRNRHMIRTMAERDLRARYIGSNFGLSWAVINPLAQVAIYGVVFGVFLGARPGPGYGTDSYFLFLLCGLLPWQFFSQTLHATMPVLMSNRSLVKKAVGFPPEILPIVSVISNTITHFIGLVLVLFILVLLTGMLTPLTPFILVYIFLVMVFSVGLGWIVSSLNVYVRDIQQVIGLVLLGWFYFTPIFYPPSRIPENVLVFLKLNPMFHVIDGYRRVLLLGQLPDAWEFAFLVLVSFATFGIGGVFFRKLKPGFGDVL